MFVAATTRCFSELPLEQVLDRLVHLEFTAIELMIHEQGGYLKPSDVLADFDPALFREGALERWRMIRDLPAEHGDAS